MMENFVKSCKWAIAIVCVILGIGAFAYYRDVDSPIHLFLGICSFGMASWMSKAWFRTEKIILVLGLGAAMTAMAVTVYTPIVLPGFYLTWALYAVIIGLPFMTWVFGKYGD